MKFALYFKESLTGEENLTLKPHEEHYEVFTIHKFSEEMSFPAQCRTLGLGEPETRLSAGMASIRVHTPRFLWRVTGQKAKDGRTSSNPIFCFVFCLFRATPAAYGSSQARGSNQSCSCQPHGIWVSWSANYTTAHSNTGSLTEWGQESNLHPQDTSWLLIAEFLRGTSPQNPFLSPKVSFQAAGWGESFGTTWWPQGITADKDEKPQGSCLTLVSQASLRDPTTTRS